MKTEENPLEEGLNEQRKKENLLNQDTTKHWYNLIWLLLYCFVKHTIMMMKEAEQRAFFEQEQVRDGLKGHGKGHLLTVAFH